MAGVSSTDVALIFVGVAYAVSLFRDWRPIRALREENRGLRDALRDLQQKYDDLEKRHLAMEKSRDFDSAFNQSLRAIEAAAADRTREHEKILQAFDEHEKRSESAWTQIARDLASNTAALSVLAAGINASTIPPQHAEGTPQ